MYPLIVKDGLVTEFYGVVLLWNALVALFFPSFAKSATFSSSFLKRAALIVSFLMMTNAR